MKPDDIVVMFAHPKDAQVILENDEIMSDSLVISTLFPEGEVMIVPRDEFMNWLIGAGDERNV